MIKGSIQEEDITLVNIHVLNIGPPQYIRQMLTAIKGEINSIIIREFNTPLSPTDTSHKMKLYNDQGTNPGRYNNCKYLCTQHRSTSIHKANTNSHKRGN